MALLIPCTRFALKTYLPAAGAELRLARQSRADRRLEELFQVDQLF